MKNTIIGIFAVVIISVWVGYIGMLLNEIHDDLEAIKEGIIISINSD